MRPHLRDQLVDLAERLHLISDDRANELSGQIAEALDADDHDGLGDRLNEYAVDFEGEHPDIAAIIRRTADALGAAGI
jgi:hypothetical protein